MYDKITGIYFSATDNTKKCVSAMVDCFEKEKVLIDITQNKEYERVDFCQSDFVIFGAPVYAGRLPYAARQRFQSFFGHNTKCVIIVSYGNRDYDDALIELKDLAEQQGFIVIGGAALVCKHTYGEIQTTRPDENDILEMKDFISQALNKSDVNDLKIKGNRPYKDGIEKGHFRPITSDECIKCGLCVKKCPFKAIDKDCKSISDKCMSCLRCVKICPKKAKSVNYKEYNDFAKMFSEKLSKRRENEYFL